MFLTMNNYRQILVSKIKFYEKMARKARKQALRLNGKCSTVSAENALLIADRNDYFVMTLTKALKDYDEELDRVR